MIKTKQIYDKKEKSILELDKLFNDINFNKYMLKTSQLTKKQNELTKATIQSTYDTKSLINTIYLINNITDQNKKLNELIDNLKNEKLVNFLK